MNHVQVERVLCYVLGRFEETWENLPSWKDFLIRVASGFGDVNLMGSDGITDGLGDIGEPNWGPKLTLCRFFVLRLRIFRKDRQETFDSTD